MIIHGTDTMAYTASALAFMLSGLGKPVPRSDKIFAEIVTMAPRHRTSAEIVRRICACVQVVLTGSIIPLCEPFNDARRNLVASLMVATRLDISEVCIFFNDKLLRGCRTHKVDADPPLPLLSAALAVPNLTTATKTTPGGR